MNMRELELDNVGLDALAELWNEDIPCEICGDTFCKEGKCLEDYGDYYDEPESES